MADSVLETKLTADNKQFISEVLRAKNEIRSLAQEIRSNYNVGLRESERIARQAFNSAAKEASKLKTEMSTLGGVIKNAFLPLIGATAIISTFRHVSEEIDKLIATASKLNIKPQTFQFLEFAAKRSDVEISFLEKSLARFRRTLGQAQLGNTSAKQAFSILGLDADKLANISLDSAYMQVSDALKQVTSSTTQATVATRLFGRDGQSQLLLLRNNIQALKKEFDELGIALSDEDIANFEKYDKATDLLAAKINSDLKQAFIALAPAINIVANILLELSKNLGFIVSQIERIVGLTKDKGKVSSSFSFATNQVDEQLVNKYLPQPKLNITDRFGGANRADMTAAGQRSAPILNLEKDTKASISSGMSDFVKFTNAATSALGTFASTLTKSSESMLKDLLNLNVSGKDYLNKILGDKEISQAVDEDFTSIAQQIKEDIASGAFKKSPSQTLQNINVLEAIAKRSGGLEFNKKGGLTETTNTGMLAAIEEFRKATANLNTNNNKTKVIIEGDPNGILKIVKTYIVGPDGKQAINNTTQTFLEQEAQAQ